jgi:hypothetical protein
MSGTADKARLASLRANADAVRARAETSVMKVEILRNLSALEGMLQTCWADRFWVSTQPPILELRARRRQYSDDTLHWRQWNDFLQTRISSTLSDSLAYGLQLNATNLTSGERQAAAAARAALDDRVAHFQEAMSELALAQTLKERLLNEINTAIAERGFPAISSSGSVPGGGGWSGFGEPSYISPRTVSSRTSRKFRSHGASRSGKSFVAFLSLWRD